MYCSHCGKDVGTGGPAYCQFCGGRLATGAFTPSGRSFARYSSEKKIAGVCGGVARYFDVDPTLVRALWLLSLLLGGASAVIYLVLWFAMPLDPGAPASTGNTYPSS
jgi:phage shock protein C